MGFFCYILNNEEKLHQMALLSKYKTKKYPEKAKKMNEKVVEKVVEEKVGKVERVESSSSSDSDSSSDNTQTLKMRIVS